MKKTKLTTIAALLLTVGSYAQTFEWAKSFGSSQDDQGTSITVDASGNIYTTGFFRNTVDFDPGVGTANLTAVGGNDIFIQKLDASGNFIWAKSFGGGVDDYGYSIAVDASGNVYTTGSFRITVDFDPGAGTANFTSVGGNDIFVQKLDASGNFIWAKSFGGSSADYGYSITVDVSGNVYTTGYFFNTVDFDPGAGIANFTSVKDADIFVQKLDASGNFIWAKSFGGSLDFGSSDDYGTSITVDASGNVYTTGYFENTVDFDPGAGTANFTSVGLFHDIFVQKLDASGNFIWAKSFGDSLYETGTSITVDASGNIYTTGHFTETVDFDPGEGTANFTSEGARDVYVQKLDASGNFIWAKSFGGSSDDFGNTITLDASGNVYTTGYFQVTADFDPGAGTVNLTSAGSWDIFVQKLDASGNFIWAKSFGSSNTDEGASITLDASGNVYTTGYFYGTVDFDPGAGTANLTSAGSWDIFIQKMSQCAPTTSTDYKTDCNSYTWINGITYTASNDTATYTLLNTAGCDSIVTLNLTINSVSDINTSLDGLTLTATNANATYQWLNCDTNFGMINDETNQTFTATTNGNFAVELTQNGCVDTSACVEITTVGILENTFCQEIKVFPNPTSGKVRVAFEEALNNAEITLTDLQGKIVFTQKLDVTKEVLLEIEGDAGVYILTIKTPNERSQVKLVKK
jgi:hypothetical protein